MASKIQITIVSPESHYPSHAWPNTLALLRALQKNGQETRVVLFSSPAGTVPPEFQKSVLAVFSRPPAFWQRIAQGKWQKKRGVRLIATVESFLCLMKALRLARNQERPVIHSLSGLVWPLLLAVPIWSHCRFVQTVYGGILLGQPVGLKAKFRTILRRVVRLAVDTGRVGFVFENEVNFQQSAHLVGACSTIVPYAVNTDGELPSQAEARQRLSLPAEGKVLLFFGTHRQDKDYRTALLGCLQLSEPPLALFVGKVISDNDPSRLIAELKYPKFRVVDDFVAEDMVPFYFAASDAVALPYDPNCLISGVVIQCCQHLRPMVATATPYFSSLLEKHPCGLTFSAGDAHSFALSLQTVFGSVGAFLPALQSVREMHSWKSVSEKYVQIYSAVVPPATPNP